MELVALISAGLAVYLFIAGRTYACVRQKCRKCGQRALIFNSPGCSTNTFTQEKTNIAIKQMCTNCGLMYHRAFDDELAIGKDGAVMLAATWPIWLTFGFIVKAGMKNGERSISTDTKKLKR